MPLGASCTSLITHLSCIYHVLIQCKYRLQGSLPGAHPHALQRPDSSPRKISAYSACCSIRAKFEKVIRGAQDSICSAISEIDGTPFHQDAWTREDGGGGITRVLAVSFDSCPHTHMTRCCPVLPFRLPNMPWMALPPALAAHILLQSMCRCRL